MEDRGERGQRNPHRFAGRGNEDRHRDPRDVEEIARLRQRVRDLEVQQEERSEEGTNTDPRIWDDGDPAYNPFATEGNPFERREQRSNPLRHLGIKIDVPEFDGRSDPDWLQTIERIFELRDISENYKVKFLALKLRKYASMWWETVKTKRRREGKSKVMTWLKMKKLLREKFLPPNFRQEAFLDYHNITQESSTVEEIISEFDRLRIRCGVEEEKEQIIARFFGALRPEIADVIQLQPYYTFNELCQLALKVERQLKSKAKTTVVRPTF